MKHFPSLPGQDTEPGMCERPGCHLPAIYCEQHAPEARQVPPIRAVIEDVIRELEWDGAVRWAAVIQSLRDVL